ncbi:MAG: cysteine synthase [Alphaproteobacteria bacterium CG_4_10_14_0_2_um_filter_63_37]|nr:MAG: cysteine synthase [Proteobacteria bacterium CG1_02_64_396]PJA24649.1 MAG: cysteine synthase [Alphaproteobacteria bacterium CG_4_10_14_0_2_um_filter_63_37]
MSLDQFDQDPLFGLVGNTPLLPLSRTTGHLPEGVRISAKIERNNPGGSVKDRAALRMIRQGLAEGRLREGLTILDSTSGNTGIALAWIGARLGMPVHLIMPANVSEERKRIIGAFGATVTLTDPMEGSDGAMRVADEMYHRDPNRFFKPDQYHNPENPMAHTDTTAQEIWQQSQGTVTHFVAALGTSGTAMGTTRGLKGIAPAIQCFGAMPSEPFHGIEGLKHMPSSINPTIYHPSELDGIVEVGTEAAYRMAQRLAREEGILVGQSSGCALAAALELARRVEPGQTAHIVTVFPDGGEKYLTTRMWESLGGGDGI